MQIDDLNFLFLASVESPPPPHPPQLLDLIVYLQLSIITLLRLGGPILISFLRVILSNAIGILLSHNKTKYWRLESLEIITGR